MFSGALVFYMQAGFAMLEAGIVQPKNSANILFKNLIDASLAAVWCVRTRGGGGSVSQTQECVRVYMR